MKKYNFINLVPNTLSFFRISLILPFSYFLNIFLHTNRYYFLLIILFLLIITTDLLDGHIARKLECTSSLGAVLDVIADSLFAIVSTTILFHSGIICLDYLTIMLVKLIEFFLTSKIINLKINPNNSILIFDYFGKLSGILYIVFPIIICTLLKINIWAQLFIRIGIVSIFLISLVSLVYRLKLTYQQVI